jgi:Flp pilus assembly protein TadG
VGLSGALARRRRARQRDRGVTMVEFALIAPILFTFLMGTVVLAIVISNQVQLTNVTRDGARAAAICGGAGIQAQASGSNATNKSLPNGSACTGPNLVDYINKNLVAIPGGVSPQINILVNGQATGQLSACQQGQTVVVTASYPQPLYLPLVGSFLGDAGNPNTRTLNATAQATCEQ